MNRILITGAAAGPGRGTALGLARAGHRVIATARIWPQVAELRRHVAEQGLARQITVEKLDVLDERDVRAAAAREFDTFVSNAAIGDYGPLVEIPVELVRRTFETDVFGNLDLTQRIIRRWTEDGVAGRIIVVGSDGPGARSAGERALEAIAATLRDELAPTDITVHTINPGRPDIGRTAEADLARLIKPRPAPRQALDQAMDQPTDQPISHLVDHLIGLIGAAQDARA